MAGNNTKPPSGITQHPDFCPHTETIHDIQRDVSAIKAMSGDIHEIKTALVGDIKNGKPGLFEIMRDHSARLDSIEGEVRDHLGYDGRITALESAEKNRKKWIGSIVGLAIASAFASVWQFIFGK